MNLNGLLCPESVAIVGASGDTKKLSGMILDFLMKSSYEGVVYPINPKYTRIGEVECYACVQALPSTVDLLVCVIPVSFAMEAIAAAARRGVRYCLLMTGGFGEGRSGEEGRARLTQLQQLCEETGMRIVGPNTVGMVNFKRHMPLTFADWYSRDTGQRGGVAIVTHSGSVGGLIFSALQLNRIGVDYWIGLGNEATLDTADFIDHFAEDADVHTVICYMEGVQDGRKFMAACEKARANDTRIVVLKSGQYPETVRSTMAHTGKCPSFGDVYTGVLKQFGVIQVVSFSELTYVMMLLVCLGDRLGARIGILSASGGACSVIADHVIQAGLLLPELPESLQQVLNSGIPIYGSSSNPIDLSADVVARGDILDATLEALKEDDCINVWMVFGRPVIDRYHQKLAHFAQITGKALIACSGVPLTAEVAKALHEGGVATVTDPELCMRAIARIANVREEDSPTPKRFTVAETEESTIRPLALPQASALLQRLTISTSTKAKALLRVEAWSDPDFGLVMGASWQPALSIGRSRVVRALPLQGTSLSSMVTDLVAQGTHCPLNPVQVYDAMQMVLRLHESAQDVPFFPVDFGCESGELVVCSVTQQAVKL
ncbi:MAG: CoA-binding protein [Advenella sp.]